MATVLLVAGCASGPAPTDRPTWTALALPGDPRGRAAIRAIAACGDRLWLSGGILGDGPGATTQTGTAAAGTAPALWVGDGIELTAVAVQPRSAYGPTHVLYSVACRGGDAVAVGASNGGAHGNARVNTWLSVNGGPVGEVLSPFEMFNGADALGVGGVAGGPGGYVIVGARSPGGATGGAAVWVSPDGHAFTLVDRDPALASDSRRGVTEVHAAAATEGGFVAVGAITPPGSHLGARDPMAWRSTDGKAWVRDEFPKTAEDDVLLDVAAAGDGAVAVGTDGDAFRMWNLDREGRWRPGARFGHIVAGGTVPAVSSIAVDPDGGRVYVVVADGDWYHLYDGTREVDLPARIAAAPVVSGPRVVVAAVAGGRIVLATDDGRTARVWTAPAAR